jgi:short-subunit dehydrogenase
MTPEDLVDASLAGLDASEAVTIPSLHNDALFAAYDAARTEMFIATVNGTPAPRYHVAH